MTRDHGSDEAGAATYPVLSDRPIEVHNPQRKVRIIAAAYAAAIIVTALFGAYVAASIAVERSDSVRHQLRQELDQRTRERDAENTRLRAELDQAERDLCAATAVIPQTPPVLELRTRHRCGPADSGASSPPSASGDQQSAGGGQGPEVSSRSGTDGSSTPPRSGPRPGPAPAPGPPQPPRQPAPGIPSAPTPPEPAPWLCLPLVGCIL